VCDGKFASPPDHDTDLDLDLDQSVAAGLLGPMNMTMSSSWRT
jgi:hypothetical protein